MRLRKFDWAVTFGCMALLGYFAWHANEGQRGYKFRDKLASEAERLEADLVEQEKRRSAFEARVELLRPESIDPDLLDEMARVSLEMAKPDEIVVRSRAQ
jgi:cell division protein FtsB